MSGNENEDERSFRHVGRKINDDRRDRAEYRRGNGVPIGTAGCRGRERQKRGQRGYECGRFIR
jgi:hypothetical protein